MSEERKIISIQARLEQVGSTQVVKRPVVIRAAVSVQDIHPEHSDYKTAARALEYCRAAGIPTAAVVNALHESINQYPVVEGQSETWFKGGDNRPVGGIQVYEDAVVAYDITSDPSVLNLPNPQGQADPLAVVTRPQSLEPLDQGTDGKVVSISAAIRERTLKIEAA